MEDAALKVVHRPEEHRYELLLDGEHAGELVYRDRGEGVLALVHTEVDTSRREKGLGSALLEAALADIRSRGLRVIPVCPFVVAYVRRHPDVADLVAD